MKSAFLYIAILFGFSCTEVNLVDSVPGPPSISFISIEPKVVREFKDSIIIRIRYQDPDGDFGHSDPDIELLSVHDLRLKNPDGYHVSPLAPKDSKISIDGELEIYLKNSFLLGTGDEEPTSYELIMTDRSGNKSNAMITDQIRIVR